MTTRQARGECTGDGRPPAGVGGDEADFRAVVGLRRPRDARAVRETRVWHAMNSRPPVISSQVATTPRSRARRLPRSLGARARISLSRPRAKLGGGRVVHGDGGDATTGAATTSTCGTGATTSRRHVRTILVTSDRDHQQSSATRNWSQNGHAHPRTGRYHRGGEHALATP